MEMLVDALDPSHKQGWVLSRRLETAAWVGQKGAVRGGRFEHNKREVARTYKIA